MPAARATRQPSVSSPPPTGDRTAGSFALTGDVARGDSSAFARFYDAWFDRTYALVRGISRRDDAFCMDATQDVMLRVARHMRRLPDDRAVAAWMAKTAFTTCADLVRRERRRGRHERRAAELAVKVTTPCTAAEHAETLDWLHSQLAVLDSTDRLLLRERFGNDRTLAELGVALGITGDAVHGRIRRAVSRLRKLARRWNDE